MLPSPEERKRMREEKAVQRAAKQRKQTRVRLIVAAVVLLLCGVLIFALSRKQSRGGAPDSADVSNTQQTQSETTAPAAPEQSTPEKTVIHYVSVGDLNINDLTVAAGGTGYDYTEAFMDIAHLLFNLYGVSCNAVNGYYQYAFS